MKLLINNIHINDDTSGFHQQTLKLLRWHQFRQFGSVRLNIFTQLHTFINVLLVKFCFLGYSVNVILVCRVF